jgi:hypothetical protein
MTAAASIIYLSLDFLLRGRILEASVNRETRKAIVKYVALTLSNVCRQFSPRCLHSISMPHVQIDINFKSKSFFVVCDDNMPTFCISAVALIADIFFSRA